MDENGKALVAIAAKNSRALRLQYRLRRHAARELEAALDVALTARFEYDHFSHVVHSILIFQITKERFMPKTRIVSPAVAEAPPGRWSNAIRAGEFLFISGQVSRANDGKTMEGKGEYEQSKIIFTRIKNLVEAAGGTLDDVARVTIYVVDIKKNTEVWRARQEFFKGDFPASTLVQVAALGTPEVLVEIEAIAHIGDKKM